VSTSADLERWSFLPADTLPVGGRQISDRARELIAGAVVTRNAPTWVGDRRADAWLLSADGSVACPLLWSASGELVATIALQRDQTSERPGAWLDDLRPEPEPLGSRQVQVTPHARARWNERRSNADLDAALASAQVRADKPAWVRAKDADGWLLLGDATCAPLVRGIHGEGAVVVTFLTLEGASRCAP